MRKAEELKAQIAALQAELAEIEADGFKPLSELARDLQPGDLIELRVDEVDKNHNCPVRAGKEWFMRDTLARKSRSAPALQWITAAEAAKMPDIVGKRVAVEFLVCGLDTSLSPLRVSEHNSAANYTFWLDKPTKLAVLDDE